MKKYAIYLCLPHDFETINEVTEAFEEAEDYIRITEPVEVNFKPLLEANIITEKIIVIDRAITTIQNVALAEVNKLNTEKQKLLALPNDNDNAETVL